jgi:starch phosphorylase
LKVKRLSFNKRRKEIEKRDASRKKICYICMEFLMGQSLKNNLYNLGATDIVEEIIREKDVSLSELFEQEPDAGLGNGGLGRLAACFMDALATGGYDATGYSLCYQYGLFKQKIVDGWQVELPDNWLPGGRVWLNAREDDTFKVTFYGEYDEYWTDGKMGYNLNNPQVVEAVPYDMYISGADSDAVAKLRLWKARDYEGFDMDLFNSGDFTRAAQKTNSAELITKVLYPADNIEEGKELRLKQQYFMVSASCPNIVRNQFRMGVMTLLLISKRMNAIRKIYPLRYTVLHQLYRCSLNTSVMRLNPSSGGIGIRLNTIRTRLIITTSKIIVQTAPVIPVSE